MMGKPILTTVVLLLCLTGLVSLGCGSAESYEPVTPVKDPGYDPDAPTDQAMAGSNTLAIDLYHELASRGRDNDNLFFSPLSVSAALMLAYEGARGQTQQEFQGVLSLDSSDRAEDHKAYAGVLGRLSSKGKRFDLSIANALWSDRSLPLSGGFVQTLQSHYAASIESADFRNDYDTQRRRINAWVANRTRDRVVDLLPPDALSRDTRLVLVNAVYFKDRWQQPFSERSTRDEPFYLLPGGPRPSVSVPMMCQRWMHGSYAEGDSYQALELFYEYSPLSMVILLPRDRGGLAQLEARLDAGFLEQVVGAMSFEWVNLWLPKWETTQSYDLVPALKAMGLVDAFDERRADFTGVSGSADGEALFLAGVYHKAFIAVDEEGAEAAAATGAAAGDAADDGGQEPKVYDFRADHPFIYLIRDEQTGTILFMGRVADPS